MAAGWTDASLSESRSGDTITFTLSGTSFQNSYGNIRIKTWTFYLAKDGSTTSQQITGGSPESAWRWKFDGDTFTYSISAADKGKTITFSVVGSVYVELFNGTTFTETTTDNPSVAVEIPAPPQPSVTWNSGASITATPNNNTLTVTVTRSGGATLNNASGTVYYRLWCGSTRKNNDGDSGSSWTITPTAYDTSLTYYLEAYAVVSGTTYTTSSRLSASATVVSGNYVDYYNGSSWVQCKAYYYNGSSWVECKPFYYDGTSWVECSS